MKLEIKSLSLIICTATPFFFIIFFSNNLLNFHFLCQLCSLKFCRTGGKRDKRKWSRHHVLWCCNNGKLTAFSIVSHSYPGSAAGNNHQQHGVCTEPPHFLTSKNSKENLSESEQEFALPLGARAPHNGFCLRLWKQSGF